MRGGLEDPPVEATEASQMDTYIVIQDRCPSRTAPRRADARLKIGLAGTLLLSVICSVGPSLSAHASTPAGQIAALAAEVMA